MRRTKTMGAPRAVLAVALVLGLAAGCGPKRISPEAAGAYLDRAQTQQRDGVEVTVAVPSATESEALFDVPLYARGVQPVWLQIRNDRSTPVGFLPFGLDPGYFTPAEAASVALRGKGGEKADAVTDRFVKQGMELAVPAGETRSGFMFTQLDEGTKRFNVDLIDEDEAVAFHFFVPVPGLKLDHYDVDWENLYPADQIVPVTENTLIGAIEAQPCCVRNEDDTKSGDPLNLVVIGDLEDVYYAFLRAGWDETETVHRGSAWKTVVSFLSGGEYRYSPISNLYVFGRKQDVAFQKARSNIHERNHLRLWLSRARYEGKPVWIGQISRDIGVRFTPETITTHKIDPDVDETREFLLEDLAYAQSLAKFGYVGGVGPAPEDAPRGNLTGDPYFTDGYRVVLWVTAEPVSLADVEFVEWAMPYAAQPQPTDD